MIKRESGADLYRILGLLFVNTLHACLYNGFYFEAQEGWMMFLANSARWLVFSCNAMFMLLSGYLKSTSPWCLRYYKSLLAVLIGYVLTCLVSYPIRYHFIGEKDSWSVWWERFLTFSNYAWYIEMYIGLFFISPLVNLALDAIHSPTRQWVLACSLVLITVGHSATTATVLPDYCGSFYPLTLYTLGAVIRRTQPKVPALIGLLGAVLVAMGLSVVTMRTATEGFYSGFSQGYGGFWVVLMVFFLFLGVYRLRIGPRTAKVLAFLSGGVLEGYILSRLFDVWIYGKFPQWHDPRHYWKLFLCITLPVFTVSLLSGKLLNMLSAFLTRHLWKVIELPFRKKVTN